MSISVSAFSNEALEWLLRPSQSDPSSLANSENSSIEFKQSFSFNGFKHYIKTMAGFANNKGGYLIFGVTDKPRKIVGLRKDFFDQLDPRKINQFLNEYLSSQIEWDRSLNTVGGKRVGIIYVKPAKRKPIIIAKTSEEIREGDIYYRYPGETKIIKAAELQSILDQRVLEERQRWQELVGKISQLSPNDVSVLNLREGKIDEGGTQIFLDSDTVSKIKFIKEGEFHEKKGAPTLKIVGKAKEITSDNVIIQREKPTSIHINEIYDAFFSSQCSYPEEYIKQLPHENSRYLPIWFFVAKSGKDSKEVVDLLLGLENVNDQVRQHLVARLQKEDVDKLVMDSIYRDCEYQSNWDVENWEQIKNKYRLRTDASGTKKVDRSIASQILSNNPEMLLPVDERLNDYYIEIIKAISHVPLKTILKHQQPILDIVNSIRKLLPIDTTVRKAICYLDFALYGSQTDSEHS